MVEKAVNQFVRALLNGYVREIYDCQSTYHRGKYIIINKNQFARISQVCAAHIHHQLKPSTQKL